MAQIVNGVEVPDWVHKDYLDSYVNSAKSGEPRKPNMREMTELITGISIEQMYATMEVNEWSKYTGLASELLYGVVGSNQDTRNWSAIMATDDPVNAARVATNQMYGGTTVKYMSGGYEQDTNGNTKLDNQGNPVLLKPTAYLVAGNGTILRSLGTNVEAATKDLTNFGVRDTSWADEVTTQMQAADDPAYTQYVETFNQLKQSYNPFVGKENLWKQKFVSGVTPAQDQFQIKRAQQPTTATQTTQVMQGQQQQPAQTSGQQQQPQQTIPVTGAPPIPVAPAPVTPSNIIPPTGYMGTGYLPTFGTQQPTQAQQVPSSVAMYGTLPYTYTPTTPFTVGQTGTTTQQPTTTTQQSEVRTYRNNSGLTVSITFVNGQPVTPIPSGFFPADQMQSQTSVPSTMQMTATNTPQMAIGGMMPSTQNIVSGFKPNAMQRVAGSLGYTGDITGFNNYLAANPAAKQKYDSYMQAAQQMANGGYVRKYQEGGDVQKDPRVLSQQYIPQQNFPAGATLPQVQATIAKTPGLPTGATVVPVGTAVEAGQLVSPTSGQVSGQFALPTAQAATTAAAMPQAAPAAKVSTIESTGAVSATVDALQAAQGTLDPRAQVLAAQQTASSVGNVQAAQGNAILMTNPVQRQIQDGELIAPAANAETAAKFTEQIEAAEATPTKQATVQGQLEQLMTQFEGGKTPAWAAASMRNAMATLSARGLGASSLAGQAVIQAAMEAALPIAQLDAQTQASFEAQNLSNRQQRAMLAAQQRAAFLGQEFDQTFQSRVANAAKISDVANMNFTAEQQVALENSRIANTMELQNLNNRQAVVLAEAAALANMDMANLNNRQQAAVMNAQNFLAVDMQNLNNQQQTDLFKAQSRIQALFTDQAAQNASQQFNASSENQVNQFFSSLAAQVGQFNATQANAQSQFNAGQINTIERFNAEINNQRDQFNAQNRLIIDQSNAQWRREISTAATAAVNRANEINAASLVGLSQSAYNNLWQYYRDNMEWAWTSAENERQRVVNLAMAQLQADASKDIQKMKEDYESSAAFGGLIGKFITSGLTGGFSNLFG